MKRHTRKNILYNNETWTLVRAIGKCKLISGDALAQIHPDEKIIAFRAGPTDQEQKYIIHEMYHEITGLNDSDENEKKIWHLTNETIDFFKANNIDLTPLTEGFE